MLFERKILIFFYLSRAWDEKKIVNHRENSNFARCFRFFVWMLYGHSPKPRFWIRPKTRFVWDKFPTHCLNQQWTKLRMCNLILKNCKKSLVSIIFLGLILLYGDRYLRVCIYLLREIVSCQVDWNVNGDCVWLGISPLA